MLQAVVRTECLKRLLAVGHSTRVAPDDGVAQYFLLLVHANQAVHLIRYTDGFDIIARSSGLCHNLL